MYNHAPQNYKCQFCTLANEGETSYNKKNDIVYEDKKLLAFISPKWWTNNPGNVIIIPKEHVENIYDISDEKLAEVYVLSKKIAIAMKKTYNCDGTSMRQHNEPAGEQDLFHFHLHIIPRYAEDKLYQGHDTFRFVSEEEKDVYAKKLRNYFSK